MLREPSSRHSGALQEQPAQAGERCELSKAHVRNACFGQIEQFQVGQLRDVCQSGVRDARPAEIEHLSKSSFADHNPKRRPYAC